MPIIFRVFLKLCDSFADRNFPEFAQYLVITPVGERNPHGIFTNFSFALKKQYIYNEDLLKDYAFHWSLLFRLKNYVQYLREKDDIAQLFAGVLCALLYVTAGGYRLYFIL